MGPGRPTMIGLAVDAAGSGHGEALAPIRLPSPRSAGRGRPPQAAARRAGLEFVEKLLTDTMVALLDGTEREHATRVPLVASLVELATG
jgi:hypothetical protein